MSQGEPLCLIGDSGAGKSHLLIGPGAARGDGRTSGEVRAGRQARHESGEAADERVLSKTIALYGRVDLLGVDELGLHGAGPARRRAAVPGPDLREETNSIAIASDESFSGWTKTFTGPRPCAAIADRLAQCEVLLDHHSVLDDDDMLFAVPHGLVVDRSSVARED